MSGAMLASGFSDPALDSQREFRRIMDAFARPGRVQSLGKGLSPPVPLTPAAAAVALTLCDYDTTLFLSPTLAESPVVAEFLRFHTGAPLVRDSLQAAFAIVDLRRDALRLDAFALGAPNYPDRSTTIVAICESVTDGAALTLTGPGIASTATLRATSLPADFADQWRENRARYPLGVDVLLVDEGNVAGLPRAIRLSGGV